MSFNRRIVFFPAHSNLKGGLKMARHSGGKVGKAGKLLASNSSTKSQKSKAGKTLKKHQDLKH